MYLIRKQNTYKRIWSKKNMALISEEERDLILIESRSFLNDFSRKLEAIKGDLIDENKGVEARKELNGWDPDPDFKEIMFGNAPLVNDDLILAEKGAWKK
jgi:hypothetical protein